MITRIVRLLLVGILSASFGFVWSQEVQHDGFCLSMNLGPVWGESQGIDNVNPAITVTGTGFNFGIQIGGAVKTNLILHGTFYLNSIFGPKFNDIKVSDNVSFDESFYGAGLTRYFSPSNIFITGNLGVGKFIISDDTSNSTSAVSTEGGLGFQLKAGKEWAISEKWGLGAAVFYSGTHLTSRPEPNIEEKWDSGRFGIIFQATLN